MNQPELSTRFCAEYFARKDEGMDRGEALRAGLAAEPVETRDDYLTWTDAFNYRSDWMAR